MQPVQLHDILPLEEYLTRRDTIRSEAMRIKEARRVIVGPYLCFLFENRATMIYQIQEMLRVENIRDEAAIRAEIDVYNELIPADNQLKATLQIEITDPLRRESKLRELLGLEKHVHMSIDSAIVPGRFDERQLGTEKLSAVQYLTFHLEENLATTFGTARRVELVVHHPECHYSALLSQSTVMALAQDLAKSP